MEVREVGGDGADREIGGTLGERWVDLRRRDDWEAYSDGRRHAGAGTVEEGRRRRKRVLEDRAALVDDWRKAARR